MTEALSDAFAEAGYDRSYGRTVLSNRPDLCEFQCSGALAAARTYHKAPMQIAEEVTARLSGCPLFSGVSSAKPGFINLKADGEMLASYLREMASDEKLGVEPDEQTTVMIDFGGANIAKPLHVGHLRSAVIGESIKRILRMKGHKVIGDVHLGDWGLQMGLIIASLSESDGDLPYFDENFEFEAGTPTPKGTYEELIAAAQKMYHEMSPQTAEFIDVMVEIYKMTSSIDVKG